MPTIDAQVHAYERNHPGRPWAGVLQGPPEVTGDQMVAAMDAVGVDGAILVSPFSLYRYDASYALEVRARHPDRFALVKPVDPSDPAVAETIAEWAATPGTVGVRIMLNRDVSTDPADPGINRVLAAAARHSLPVNLLRLGAAGSGPRAGRAQSRHPAGDRPPRAAAAVRAAAARGALRRPAEGAGVGRPAQHRDQDQRRLHPVARAVPVSGHLGARSGASSTPSGWIAACGARTGPGRWSCLTYEQGVEAFRVTDRLSDSDRATLMGGTLTRIYNWAPAKP